MQQIYKVAVLYGGTSNEREISFRTAEAVCSALDELGVGYEKIDPLNVAWQSVLGNYDPDFVFIALHGGEGEGGTIQAMLDKLGYSYNGSGAVASALAMDKPRAKQMFKAVGIGIAEEVVYTVENIPPTVAELPLELPVVVKPTDGGSSFGVTIVENPSDWSQAVENAVQNFESDGGNIMVEKYVAGREFTVAVMNGKALDVMEIKPQSGEWYDYEAKYSDGGSVHEYPAQDLSEGVRQQCRDWAEKAHKVLGCSGITRADLRYDENSGTLAILEVNTLPGMTDVSLVPEMAAVEGYSFPQLVKYIMENASCHNREAA